MLQWRSGHIPIDEEDGVDGGAVGYLECTQSSIFIIGRPMQPLQFLEKRMRLRKWTCPAAVSHLSVSSQ